MFDMNTPLDEIRAKVKAVRIYDELERRLVIQFGGRQPVLTEDGKPVVGKDGEVYESVVKRGWVFSYLEGRKTWPLITIEPFKEKTEANGSSRKRENTVHIRATLKVDMQRDSDPDSLLRLALHHIRIALFDTEEARKHGGFVLFTPQGEQLLIKSMEETEPAMFVLPEPGLPLCSVHLTTTLTYIETQ